MQPRDPLPGVIGSFVGSHWWLANLYELRDGLIGRARVFFRPEPEAAE